ncbi:metal ABC transporter permease [Salisediminibacterium halotolerans]|uniref:Zinc transport system permease protein n=1 Tax=Salisediminibacterium halotolerans TaxID=517425 RepID=A0A1H9S8U5_9BACI|nr:MULTISPECIES: metal ABC transporter permease [Salisediminibacterium]RLJ78127.1 zinc transport system permease protein [Actinophytocola xinjiangensis]RPE88534.1 zinc transport system permease protein [Salisediminibacterium halotolerans]TWG37104.1 zinc transport system permease protein [Salisediminibacterium halotolerans]SER81432.1 zinc transport system permease protein [Salisediminibacterium haloalkalitolerans]GEL08800.1 zinc ABC transporter permease [Salisediminibacterium halotolerans]
MELLQGLSFLERGIAAGLMIGLIAPVVGAFLLVRRMTIISEGLSQVTLTGIATGVLMNQTMVWTEGINPLYTGFFFALIGSLVVERLRTVYKHFQELAIPVILSAGLGMSAILISSSGVSNTEWFNFLFGSIITVSAGDLLFIFIAGAAGLMILGLFYKEWLSISFDAEFAYTTGISVKWMNFLFAVLIALVISMSISVVGVLLVGALVTLPVASSLQLANSFRQVILYGILFGEGAVILGVIGSYYLNIATGGMIVVTGIILLFAAAGMKKVIHRCKRKSYLARLKEASS